MASSPEEKSSNWVFDCALLGELPPLDPSFRWPQTHNALPPPPTLSVEFEESRENPDCIKVHGSRKRLRSGTSGACDSKAYKEKMRRDKLNDRFQELSSILEPGRLVRMDKAVILSDAARLVIQLREESLKLKESYDNLQRKVNELKKEKNELRDEKVKLKAEKEKLEEQLKALSPPPGFLVHSPSVHAPFGSPSAVVGSKLVPFMGYPGIPMWQFMPPTAVDTSEDHALRPPVA